MKNFEFIKGVTVSKLSMVFSMILFWISPLSAQQFFGTLSGNNEDLPGLIYAFDPSGGNTQPNDVTKLSNQQENGKQINNGLTYYQGKFFGVARNGGEGNFGTIYIYTPGTQRTELFLEFNPDKKSVHPVSALTLKDGYFYGICAGEGGSTSTRPSIYKFNPNNRSEGIITVHVFENEDPFNENSGITLKSYQGLLFGAITNGKGTTATNTGVLFQFSEDKGYSIIYDGFDPVKDIAFPRSLNIYKDLSANNNPAKLYLICSDGIKSGMMAFTLGSSTPSIHNVDVLSQLNFYDAGLAKYRKDLFLPIIEQSGNNRIDIARITENNVTPFNNTIQGNGVPKSDMKLFDGKFFVGTTTDPGSGGGGYYFFNIETAQFETFEKLDPLNHGTPEYAVPAFQHPFTVWDGKDWSNGQPDNNSVAYVQGDLDITSNLTCHDLYIANSAKVRIMAGELFILNELRNDGALEVLQCQSQTLSVLGYNYGYEPVEIFPQILPTSDGNNVILPTAYIGENYSFNLGSLNMINPTFNEVEGFFPGGLTFSTSGNISGNPTATFIDANVFVEATDNITGCSVGQSFQISIRHRTTWNGLTWSHGFPLADGSSIVIIDGFASTNGNSYSCDSLIINEGKTFVVNGTSNISANYIVNNGNIRLHCTATLTPTTTGTGYSGNPSTYIEPTLTLGSSLSSGKVNAAYNQIVRVTNMNIPWTWSVVPNSIAGLSFQPSSTGDSLIIAGTPSQPYEGAVTLTITTGAVGSPGFCQSSKNYNLSIIEGFDPNLRTQDIVVTYGDKNVQAFSISDNDNIPVTYSIDDNSCATINQATGRITISCASENPIKFYVKQIADNNYKAGSDSATLQIQRADPTIVTKNTSFVLGNQLDSIAYITNSDGEATFDQFSDWGIDVATVSSDGEVTLLSTGQFTARINLPQTTNYNSKSLIRTFNVVEQSIAPIGMPDSINILIGETATINILANDEGGTAEIDPTQTDIDVENVGNQFKYYSPSMGNFLIDADGNLEIIPFKGFVGSDILYYQLVDENGLKSTAIPVYVNVTVPSELPSLKATELFTPNDDGLNDAFVIGYMDLEKNNNLRVFDRYGNEVYSKDNYRNKWYGTLENGDELDDGTYFFIFEEGNNVLKGTVQLKRSK